jgi:HPt (histidine-containing phosphotransfer) domain-containing protein
MDPAPFPHCCRPGLLLDAVGGDAAIFRELAHIFFRETVDRFDDIARYSAAGCFDDMGQEAHSLKGTAGTVGADALVQLLQQIEHAGLKLRCPCSPQQLARLSALLQAVRHDLQSFLATLPSH